MPSPPPARPGARDAFGTTFLAAAGHLDTATSGLPPSGARAALAAASAAWAEGRYDAQGCDAVVARGRGAVAPPVGAAPPPGGGGAPPGAPPRAPPPSGRR